MAREQNLVDHCAARWCPIPIRVPGHTSYLPLSRNHLHQEWWYYFRWTKTHTWIEIGLPDHLLQDTRCGHALPLTSPIDGPSIPEYREQLKQDKEWCLLHGHDPLAMRIKQKYKIKFDSDATPMYDYDKFMIKDVVVNENLQVARLLYSQTLIDFIAYTLTDVEQDRPTFTKIKVFLVSYLSNSCHPLWEWLSGEKISART